MRAGAVLPCFAVALLFGAPAAGQDPVSLPEDLRTALEEEVRRGQPQETCASFAIPQPNPWIGHPGYGRAPLATGSPPFENAYAPGLYSAVIASEGGSDEYLRLRARLELLEKLGHFTSERLTYVHPASEPLRIQYEVIGATRSSGKREIPVEQLRQPQPALRYSLTTQGWLATRGKPCLPLGTLGISRVTSLKRDESAGQQVARIEYEMELDAPSPAFERSELVRGFGEHVLRQGGVRRQRANFILTPSGWVSDRQMQAILRGVGEEDAGQNAGDQGRAAREIRERSNRHAGNPWPPEVASIQDERLLVANRAEFNQE